MVGLSKEQLLVCMGLPASKAAEGQTEVWSYNSGDGTTIASGSVSQGSFPGVSSRRSRLGLKTKHQKKQPLVSDFLKKTAILLSTATIFGAVGFVVPLMFDRDVGGALRCC